MPQPIVLVAPPQQLPGPVGHMAGHGLSWHGGGSNGAGGLPPPYPPGPPLHHQQRPFSYVAPPPPTAAGGGVGYGYMSGGGGAGSHGRSEAYLADRGHDEPHHDPQRWHAPSPSQRR